MYNATTIHLINKELVQHNSESLIQANFAGFACTHVLILSDELLTNHYAITTLCEAGFSIDQLNSLDSTKWKLFIKNFMNVVTLIDCGISIKTLFGMKKAQQKLFIKNVWMVEDLIKYDVSIDKLISINDINQPFKEECDMSSVDSNELNIAGASSEFTDQL